MDSTALIDYLNRLSDADTKSLSQRLGKTTAELSDALLSYEGAPGTLARYTSREQIIDEIADVALCLYSIARKVNATPEELSDMLLRKANKWQGKQEAAAEIKNPAKVPYEVHVSITPPSVDSKSYESLRHNFSTTCAILGVKATILTLYGPNSTWEDWMTSSTFVGTNAEVDAYMEAVGLDLQRCGFNVIRKKVETVPWHPAAKARTGCYFEKHWEVLINPDELVALCEFADDYIGAVSRNTRKPPVDGKIIASVTIRNPYFGPDEFKVDCDQVEKNMRERGFDIVDSIAEYAVYDSDVSVDRNWLKAA